MGVIFDLLWAPILTHYDADGRLDAPRAAAQIASLAPHARQLLVAGTTGDGWEMTDAVLGDWLALLARGLGDGHRVLASAFAETTEGVVARARRIEAALHGTDAPFAGLTVCAPVEAGASQERIADHLRAVLDATDAPLAVYQLPQVTGCQIAPGTLSALCAETDRIVLAKDTSGTDALTLSGLDFGPARLLRGAEASYAQHLAPEGRYDGWLLSSANGLAPALRGIAEDVATGRDEQARAASDRLSALVADLFTLAGDLPIGNPFSNANRAVDHLHAHGGDWRAQPARTASGDLLPEPFLAEVAARLENDGEMRANGYLCAADRDHA